MLRQAGCRKKPHRIGRPSAPQSSAGLCVKARISLTPRRSRVRPLPRPPRKSRVSVGFLAFQPGCLSIPVNPRVQILAEEFATFSAYSMACSSVIARPSAHAAANTASSNPAHVEATRCSYLASLEIRGRWRTSRDASTAPNSVAARSKCPR